MDSEEPRSNSPPHLVTSPRSFEQESVQLCSNVLFSFYFRETDAMTVACLLGLEQPCSS